MTNRSSEWEPAKKLLTMLATLAGVAGGLIAIMEYRNSVEQKRIENQLNIMREFSPALSLDAIKPLNFTSEPKVEISVTSEITYPVSIFVNGVNFYKCDELATKIKVFPNTSFHLNHFTILPKSSTTITMTAKLEDGLLPINYLDRSLLEEPIDILVEPNVVISEPEVVMPEPEARSLEFPDIATSDQEILNNDVTDELSEIAPMHSKDPFIVEFQFSASVFNVADFSSYILTSGMATEKRMGPHQVTDSTLFTWIYKFRAAYVDNGLAFENYVGSECIFPDNSDTSVEM